MANKFISGTLILTLSGFVVKAIGSINWIILSRILGGEGIGIYQMAFRLPAGTRYFQCRAADCNFHHYS